MSSAHLYRVIQDQAGNTVNGAQVTLCNPGTTVAITDALFLDDGLTIPTTNPFTCTNGIINVYTASPRTVTLLTSVGSTSSTIDYLDMLPNAENLLVTTTPLTITNDAFAGASLQVVDADTAQWAALGNASVGVTAGLLTLPGQNGSYVQTPDSSGQHISGDIDIRFYGNLGSLTGSGFMYLVAKQNTTLTSWILRETGPGRLQLALSGDGTTIVLAASSVSNIAAAGYRVTWAHTTGATQFFTLDPNGTVVLTDGSRWTQLGATQTLTVSGNAIYTGGSLPLTIGGAINGTAVLPAGTTVSKVEVRDGIDGTLAVSPVFTGHDFNDPSITDAQGNVFTCYGLANIIPKGVTASGNGVTATVATVGTVASAAGGWGSKRVNPVTGAFDVDNFGPAGVNPALWTVAQTSAAVRAAVAAAVATVNMANKSGATVYFSGRTYEINPDPTLADPWNGLSYCAIKTWDYLTFKGAGVDATIIKLTTGANCHVFGHPGRTIAGNNPGQGTQDAINSVTWMDLKIDGNRWLQDQAHTHDGLHIPQHPGLTLSNVKIMNCDGFGYYSNANGDFFVAPATDPGVNLVKPVTITDSEASNNARWGWFMSATNRHTSYKGLRGVGNGSNQAAIVGKTVATTLTASGGGLLHLLVDQHPEVDVALAFGDTPAAVVTKINAALASFGQSQAVTFTASYTPPNFPNQNDSIVTFASPHTLGVGTPVVFSGVTGATGITNGTTYYVRDVLSPTIVTLTLGTPGNLKPIVTITSNGSGTVAYGLPVASLTPSGRLIIASGLWGGVSRVYLVNTTDPGSLTILTNLGYTQATVNYDNNYRVGGCEYGNFILDHSERMANGLVSDSALGDGIYIHNVNACHDQGLHSTRNNGHGIYVDAWCHSTGEAWLAMMNCVDFGYASYRVQGPGGAETSELYFDNGTEGYGVSHDSTLIGFNGPGDKATIGGGNDNRAANYSIVIANGVAANGSFDIVYPKYGDGGLVGTLKDDR